MLIKRNFRKQVKKARLIRYLERFFKQKCYFPTKYDKAVAHCPLVLMLEICCASDMSVVKCALESEVSPEL